MYFSPLADHDRTFSLLLSLCSPSSNSPPNFTTMAPEPEKEYTMDEVAKHNTPEDCWLVIGNDATGEMPQLFGLICERCGKEEHVVLRGLT